MNTAMTILDQLGGKKFIIMTGAKVMDGGDSLHIRIPMIARKFTRIVIELNSNDLYDVKFIKWNSRKLDSDVKIEVKDVYCEMLNDILSEETGLAISL